MSMITATAWVPRGHAAAFPTKYVFDDDEYGRIAKLAKLQLEDAEGDLAEAQAAASTEEEEDGPEQGGVPIPTGLNGSVKVKRDKEEIDDDLKEYDLENYDEDEAIDSDGEPATMGMFANIKSLAYHSSNADDPYITIDGANGAAGDYEDDEEREELQIYPSDNLLLAARIEDEIAHLEVHVYEDDADNLYVHHDIMLPAYPLCVEWLNIGVGKSSDDPANFVAVGTMDPDIEVWDLDTIDCMYPNAILGPGAEERNGESNPKKKKKKKKSKKPNDKYHVDAVLSLAANKQHRNLLASSSADTTVKLWDLHTAMCAKSYELHGDKVCSIAWNTAESTVLLTGSYDRTITASDMRAPGAKVPRWRVESDVETVRWDPHRSELFYVSTESGLIHCYDVRSPPSSSSSSTISKALWSLQAHDESLSSFDINPLIPGFIATGSTDKTVKLWSVDAATGPSMVISRDLDVGKVFSTTFAPDQEVGFRLAVAGSKGSVMVWDTSTNAAVRKIFGERVPRAADGGDKDKVVGVEASDDESENEDEEEEEGEDEDERSESPSEDDSDEVMDG